jgi:hypothetical protein
MLPPSDSFHHQELKLAEALSNIQAIEVPPPSYTLMPVTTHESFHAYATDEEDDEEDCLTPLAPIAVHIDASIRIEGQGNTILLPPTHSTVSGQAGPGRPAPAAHARAERLTGAILTALRDAGVVGGGGGVGDLPEARGQRPLELHVNASVSVNGERNVICAGILPRVGRKEWKKEGSGFQHQGKGMEGDRKRRAESVS